MSDTNTNTTTGRQPAVRAFAQEFNAAVHQFTENPDEERAPNFLLLPTGRRANRVFAVGTLTETEDVGSESEYWQGRIVGPTGTFFAYAGKYQPDPAAKLRELDPPAYVAVVGKARTYETDDGNVNVSLQPESLTVVDQETRDRWVIETATQTAERIQAFDEEDNPDAAMAQEQYDVDLDEYAQMVREALGEFGDESAEDGADTADAEDGGEQAGSPA